jgi:hypothetical protein
MRGSQIKLEPPSELPSCTIGMKPLSWMVESRQVDPAAVAHQLKAQLPAPLEDESLWPVTTRFWPVEGN